MKSQLDGPRDALRAIEDQKAADARAAKSKVPKVRADNPVSNVTKMAASFLH